MKKFKPVAPLVSRGVMVCLVTNLRLKDGLLPWIINHLMIDGRILFRSMSAFWSCLFSHLLLSIFWFIFRLINIGFVDLQNTRDFILQFFEFIKNILLIVFEDVFLQCSVVVVVAVKFIKFRPFYVYINTISEGSEFLCYDILIRQKDIYNGYIGYALISKHKGDLIPRSLVFPRRND